MRGVEEGRPEAVLVTGAADEALRMAGGPWAFLGLWAGRPVFAVDCSAAEDPLPLLSPEMGRFADLRPVAGGGVLVESDDTLSRVYHELKWSLPDGSSLLVVEVAANKMKGQRAGVPTWVRGRLGP